MSLGHLLVSFRLLLVNLGHLLVSFRLLLVNLGHLLVSSEFHSEFALFTSEFDECHNKKEEKRRHD
ncbi:hypothetical protein Q5O89_04325 [Peribacillus frigoritolerans]|nr:hypothetical protein [Peribacillus frigoritolerans]